MSSIKKQSGKSANQAKIFNFLFRKLQKIRINFDEKFKINTKELVYENDTDPSNLVTISKKSMSKILKFNNKKITDLQNYLFFLFDFYETNNFENISKFNVNFKLLVCLVKFFYIGIKNDENKIKFNKEAMLKIFKMAEITQYNVLDYLDIYQIKIEEYSGKTIFLLAGKNVLKKKYSHFFIKKFNFLFGIAFKPKKLKTNKIFKSDEILNNLGIKLKKIYEDEYQKTNSEIIKKFIGNINVFNDLNDENENVANSKSKIYRNVLKSNVNKNKIGNDFNQSNIPFSFKIENSEKDVKEKENYVPESVDVKENSDNKSLSKEERLKSRLKKIKKPKKNDSDVNNNGEKIQKEIESIVIENKDNQGDENNNKEEVEKRLKDEEEKRLKEEEEKRIKEEEEKRIKEEEEKRLKEEEEKRLKEEEEKRLKEEEEKRIKEEEEKRLKEEEEKRLKEEEEKRLKEEEEKRIKEEEEKRLKEEEEKRLKEEEEKR